MIALCCYFDDAAILKESSRASKKILKQWTHLCKAFKVYHLIVIGKDVPTIHDAEIKVEVFKTYNEVRDKYQKEKFVVVIEGGEPLKSFRHHKSCIYVVGSNYSDPEVRQGDRTVGLHAAIPLHDINAAAIVLHNRFR